MQNRKESVSKNTFSRVSLRENISYLVKFKRHVDDREMFEEAGITRKSWEMNHFVILNHEVFSLREYLWGLHLAAREFPQHTTSPKTHSRNSVLVFEKLCNIFFFREKKFCMYEAGFTEIILAK